jgi:hypothetical protein
VKTVIDVRPEKKPPYRLAFKIEGEFINCYYAEMDNLIGAVLLGSLRHSLAEADNTLWQGWKLMMARSFRDEVQRLTGSNIVGNMTITDLTKKIDKETS